MRVTFEVAITTIPDSPDFDYGNAVVELLNLNDYVADVDISNYLVEGPRASLKARLDLIEAENKELRLKLAERDKALQKIAFQRTETTRKQCEFSVDGRRCEMKSGHDGECRMRRDIIPLPPEKAFEQCGFQIIGPGDINYRCEFEEGHFGHCSTLK